MNIKQYLSEIKSLCRAHAQINTVKSGNQFNFNAASDILYPVAHIEYLAQAAKSYQFLVTIADIFDPNLEDSEEDIYSDCNQVADDIIAYFANKIQDAYTINEEPRIEKFNNGHTDRLAGCTFLLVFTETNVLNACSIPFK